MKKDRVYINQLGNTPKLLNYDLNTEWMQEILKELNEDVDSSLFNLKKGGQDLKFEGTIERKRSGRYGDYALLEGEVSANFYTTCVSTGEVMMDKLFTKVKATFIEEKYKDLYQLEEETSLFLDDDEYELYYLNNNKCEVKDVIHEMIFLNKNPYPKKISTNL